MATAETKLLTAEEYFLLGDSTGYSELVSGRIVPMNQPGFRHGRFGIRLGYFIERYLEEHDSGRSTGLDSGVVTQRDPDSVRGADLAYYSYQRLPAEEDPAGYPNIAPEIVWEVLSPSDRRKDVLGKVHEYLQAGVLVVCVIDPEREDCITYYPDQPEEQLSKHETWRCEAILPGFELSLAALFGKKK